MKDANIILLGIDTLRYDHLGCSGYDRPTSPHIDALSRRSMTFKNCFSQSTRTAPSFMSLMTSLYPSYHGVISNISSEGRAWRLDPKALTLSEILQSRGYKTAAFTENAMILPESGFERGFDVFETKAHTLLEPRAHPFLQWLSKNTSEKFFAFFHTYAVHGPYFAPQPYTNLYTGEYTGRLPRTLEEAEARGIGSFYKTMFELREDPAEMQYVRDLYDGSITYLDSFVGGLVELLEEKGLMSNTIIALVSDHGEEFMEHGGFSHKKFYDEILHVPLIIYAPSDRSPREVEQLVRNIDVAPTLLDLAEIEQPASFQGQSLVEASEREFNLVAPAEYLYLSALRTKNFKYIFTPASLNWKQETRLFNISLDPKELQDLAPLSKELVERLHHELNTELAKKNLPRTQHEFFHIEYSSMEKNTRPGIL